MTFTLTDQYADPRTVDLKVIDQEVVAGNPYAVILKANIYFGGFGRGLKGGLPAAVLELENFCELYPQEPLPFFAAILFRARRDHYENLSKKTNPKIAKLLPELKTLASHGDRYAGIFLGLMTALGVVVPMNRLEGIRLLDKAASPKLTSLDLFNFQGDAFVNFELTFVLLKWRNELQSKLRICPPRERKDYEKAVAGIGDRPERLGMAAANAGHAGAQFFMGNLLRVENVRSVLAAGRTLPQIYAQAETWLQSSSNQEMPGAQFELAKVFVAQERFSLAEHHLREIMSKQAEQEVFGISMGRAAHPFLRADIQLIGVYLGQILERTTRFTEASDLYLALVDRRQPEDPVEAALAFVALNTVNSIEPTERLGWMPNEHKALEICIHTLDTATHIDSKTRSELARVKSQLDSRAWIRDSEQGYRRATSVDKPTQPDFVFLPPDADAAFATLKEWAVERPSSTLYLELADRVRSKPGSDSAEATDFIKKAADLGSPRAIMEVAEATCQDPADILATLRIHARVLQLTLKDLSRSRLDQAQRRSGRVLKDILAVSEIGLPPVWIYETTGYATPLTTEAVQAKLSPTSKPTPFVPPKDRATERQSALDFFDRTVLIPSDPQSALAWLEDQATRGSIDAALLAAKYLEAKNQQHKATAMYEQAAVLGHAPSLIEVAQRLFDGNGVDVDKVASFHVLVQADQLRHHLNAADQKRYGDLWDALYPNMWGIHPSEPERLQRLSYTCAPDAIPNEFQLAYIPPDGDLYADYVASSPDLIIEVLDRTLKGRGGFDTDLTEAFKLTSLLLFGETIGSEKTAIVCDKHSQKPRLLKLWHELAQNVTLNERDGVVEFVLPDSPSDASPLLLPNDEIGQAFAERVRGTQSPPHP